MTYSAQLKKEYEPQQESELISISGMQEQPTNPSPQNEPELKPRINVIGIGGAGGNAVNNMIRSKLEGCEFVVCNTDHQALHGALPNTKIQLGMEATQGLGAGSRPEVGKIAAEESLEDIMSAIRGSNMVFITAGMGGGTGTGATPVVAKAAREAGILTVGVVTKPFHFEGAHRMRAAEKGIEDLQKHVDTLIVIPNQNLFRVANEKTTFADAFKMADDVLYSGVRSVTDLMIMPGLINLDFADVRTVMLEMGKAMMGTGEAEGENRSIAAAEAAISNPLLDEISMKGARGVLISITGGMDMTLFEVDEAANRIREEVDGEANIIFGSTFDERLNGKIRVSVVATGIESDGQAYAAPRDAEDMSAQDEPHHDEPLSLEDEQGLETVRTEEEFEDTFVEDPVEGTPFENPPMEPKRGFFKRMADSLMGKKESPQHDHIPPEFSKRKEDTIKRETPQTPEKNLSEEQVISDIPAYIRKKKR